MAEDSRLGAQSSWPTSETERCGRRQPVQTTEQGGIRGYDAANNVSGRKRHVLVDTLGLVLLVVITAANAPDRAAARILLSMLATRFRRLRVVWADRAYAGSGLQHWVRRLRPWGKVRLEIVRKPRRTARLCGPAVALDRGANVCVVWPMATAQGGLRVFAGNHRSTHSHCDDSAHAAKTGANLTFSNALLGLAFGNRLRPRSVVRHRNGTAPRHRTEGQLLSRD
jgi:hypothetical protein